MHLFISTGHHRCLLFFCALFLLTGCKDNALTDEPSDALTEARSLYDTGYKYDFSEQKRLGEIYYHKAYDIIKQDPSQDWELYEQAGYRYSCLAYARGNLQEATQIISDMLAKTEEYGYYSPEMMWALYIQMATYQESLMQHDEAQATYLKAYQEMLKIAGGENKGSHNMMVTCATLCTTNLESGHYDEAAIWIDRLDSELQAYKKADNRKDDQVVEYTGLTAIYRAWLLDGTGHEKEAKAIFNSIPDSCMNYYLCIGTAPVYLYYCKHYSEAADMFARLDTTFNRDIQLTLEKIGGIVRARYQSSRHAGRTEEALSIADMAFEALDSALVWQKKDDATELTIIYQTHQKELELEESKAQARIRSILLYTSLVVILLIAFLLLRAIHFNRVLSEKNRKLYDEIEQNRLEQQHEMEQLQAAPEAALTTEQQLYRRLCTLMDEQKPYTDENLNRDILAQLLGTNSKYVEQAIRQCSKGETVSDFINRYRLEKIARLLKETDDPIAIIGEQCGIPSRATLARLFRNTYGMTPTEYRDI